MEEALSLIYNQFLKNPSVVIDSRKVKPGDLFFALKGDRFDGNRFAAEVIASGAAMAVVDDSSLINEKGCIWVEDTLKALQLLANRYRNSLNVIVIGITGSNGKTTTKELIAKTLSEKYNVLATKGNLNNHIGVPFTLLKLKKETQIAVIEMGANHPGEIDALCKIAEPGYGIITNIGRAHLEGFGGFEGVIRTKTEMYRYIRQSGGQIFFNVDNPLLKKHIDGIKSVTYGAGENAEIRGELLASYPFVKIQFSTNDNIYAVESKLSGNYNFENILAAICIGIYFKVPPEGIKRAIESYLPSNNRSQLVRTSNNLLIMDAYNANPSSMDASIKYFAGSDSPQKVLILGEMLELGDESIPEHQKLVKLVDELGFREVYFVGDSFKNAGVTEQWFHSNENLSEYFKANPLKGKTILIKGSRGNALEKIADCL